MSKASLARIDYFLYQLFGLSLKRRLSQPSGTDACRSYYDFNQDYVRTVDWYKTVLGFEVVREWDIAGYPDVDVGYISANGFMIEVVGTKQPFQDEKVAPDVFTAMSDRGYVHMAFSSADVDAVAAELVSRGVELELPPTNFDAAGVRLLFIRDNNGNLIEIVTPALCL